MGIKQAIVERIQHLCRERSIKYNSLATASGVTPSTAYSMLDAGRKDLGVVVLKKLCGGLDITITEFFDDDIFRNLTQEIEESITRTYSYPPNPKKYQKILKKRLHFSNICGKIFWYYD